MDRDRTTPQYIESLKEGEVFVFGSNKEGMQRLRRVREKEDTD